MAKQSISRARKAATSSAKDLSGVPPYPKSAEDKIVSARSIVISTTAALDGEQCEFDPHWTLSVAVAILDQALEQLDQEAIERRRDSKRDESTLTLVPGSDLHAWQQGADLAIDMIEAADDLDEMALESDCRNGRPQKNVVAGYVDRLLAVPDRRVRIAFAAVLTEYIASCEGGGRMETDSLREKSREPIETEVRS